MTLKQAEPPADIALVGDQIHFDAQHFWAEGEFDHPDLLIECLKEQPGLEDYSDDRGNMQSAVRLDADPDGHTGIWITIPVGTSERCVSAALKAYPERARQRDAEQAEQEATL